MLGISPFTVCTGLAPRFPVPLLSVYDYEGLNYDMNEVSAYVDELVHGMVELCKETV